MKKLKIFNVILILLASSNYSSIALSNDVPDTLFEITLGGTYYIGDTTSGRNTNLPIKKFMGIKPSVGDGIIYYFRPNRDYKYFDYKIKSSFPKEKYNESSFKLYLLPHKTIARDHDTAKQSPQWEVISIDWARSLRSENAAYEWAKKLCQRYQMDYTMKSDITDFQEKNWYECRFVSGDRILDVGGMGARANISLHYKADVIIEKENSSKTKK